MDLALVQQGLAMHGRTHGRFTLFFTIEQCQGSPLLMLVHLNQETCMIPEIPKVIRIPFFPSGFPYFYLKSSFDFYYFLFPSYYSFSVEKEDGYNCLSHIFSHSSSERQTDTNTHTDMHTNTCMDLESKLFLLFLLH